ncbi:hypothetical protein Poli38472_002312 [Pythium oligandrum]|uniref:alpha-1,2-Mannosidase n=1 Tax=Pythium oligandrum TaxID=41045 RepID=A0A8K1CIG9_PYTOL|nr:hypothetical protein Poli38472_002312 [Pythium oligandrum]|eukprot:TMW63371.1 hypothetical protein Poli38472_002312 [Pythium oligandrum]
MWTNPGIRDAAFVWRRITLTDDLTSSIERHEAVKRAMQFVWKNYREQAFGADELRPLDGLASNRWGHSGCMILDSLDTLYIMDMKEDFDQGRRFVADELSFDHMGEISVFETIIRNLGGLLSAYDLSKDSIFLDRAVELAQRLLPAISQSDGRADYLLNTATNRSSQPGQLSESGTYQLEFEYLSAATGDATYATYARNFYESIASQQSVQLDGLFANQIAVRDPIELTISMGSEGDSFYEYLLKVWIFTGQQPDDLTKKLYNGATDGMEKHLLRESTKGQLYLADYDMINQHPIHHMEHLACFVPGLLALGAHRMQATDPERSMRHLSTAKRLMKTCYEEFYAKQPTGLAPECLDTPDLVVCSDQHYELRPEVVESLYVLHQVTGDQIYQDWGWNIFSAIEKHCRVKYGYAVYRDVTQESHLEAHNEQEKQAMDETLHLNRMHTFFSAETLNAPIVVPDPTGRNEEGG